MLYYIPLMLTIALAYIPSFAWLVFVLSQDVHQEKVTDIVKSFILGSFIALPVILVAVWGREFLDIFMIEISGTIRSFVFGALSEEIIKGAFVYWFAISTKRWDEPIDTFVYASTLALGFAGIENLAYVLSYYNGDFLAMQQLLIVRAFTSVIIHIISSFIFTYGLVFFFKYKSRATGIYMMLGSILFHGLWNLAIELSRVTGNLLIVVFYFIICLPLFICMILIVKHLRLKSE